MSIRNVSFLLSILILALLASCKPTLPDEAPDLIDALDVTRMNIDYKISVSRDGNTFKPGDTIRLEMENLTDQPWDFNVRDDIFIYRNQDGEWKFVSDKMIDIGAIDLTLEPKGTFPGGERFIPVVPDVETDQKVYLRIYVIAHHQETDERLKETTGAYVDLVLSP